jgi:protocatechuate 4,5-dioxygenase, beta chain
MAQIIGAIGVSHAPSMENVYDKGATVRESEEWQPLFGPLKQVGSWLEALNPDGLLVIYNDHMDHFFLNAYPTFALGVGEEYPIADEGHGARPFPPVKGMPDLSWHLLRSLIADEFDMTFSQQLEVDHGVISPLPMIDFAEGHGWSVPIIPLAVNVIIHPIPSIRRCWKLGQALRRGIESFPADSRIVIVGTGGLSHQLTGPQFGRVTADWDQQFMKLLAEEPEKLLDYTYEDFIKLGGTESVEIVHWIMMRAALPRDARPFLQAYYAHKIMGYGVQAYDLKGSAQ